MTSHRKLEGDALVRYKTKRLYVIAGTLSGSLLGIGLLGACGQQYGDASDYPPLNDTATQTTAAPPPPASKAPAKKAEPQNPADIDVVGDKVDNIRPDANAGADYCEEFSNLPAGEGKADKGGTCLSVPIGEIAKNPVRVSIIDPPAKVKAGKGFDVKVLIADKNGPIDLNAFTKDETGKAGKAFLEHPGELEKSGTPLMHAHLGVTTLDKNGFPGENYDAAFTGLQSVKGDLVAKVGGLDPGTYRADVFASQPGHLILPTNVATRVQAIDTFEFEVR